MQSRDVAEKILNFLKNNPIYSYNAPTIYKKLHGEIPINSIRSELRRLCEKKLAIRELRGFYRVNISPEALYYLERPPTLLHGIMVSMNTASKLQKAIHGITSTNYKKDLKNLGFKEKTNNRLIKALYYHNDITRLITITVHEKGRIDIYLNCSKQPVNYFEFRDILNFCEGKLDFLSPFLDQRVIQFGMAKDFREIRLDGVNSLTLRAFMDSWFRVYNKDQLGVTRIEQHVRCNLPVDTFVNMFERMFLPVGNGYVHKEDERRDVA